MADGKVFVSDGSGWVDVTNTADVTALENELTEKADSATVSAHISNTSNPHSVTKAQVGLSNVDNTSDLNKPISSAAQTALNAKADTSTLTAHTGNTSNPHSVTKSQVGLANVDNTSDANKPISTAVQTALSGKSDTSHTHDSRYYTETETDTLLSGKSPLAHVHTDNDTYEYIPTPSTISGVVGTRLTVPTHVTPSGGQTTHPSVVFVPDGWNGYKYWMAHTPYPAGNDAYEDPNICASNDGITWVVPAGLTNPIDDQPGSPTALNSDVDLRLVNNTMYLFWRTYSSVSTGTEEQIYYSTSSNGTTWATKASVYTANQTALRMVSPTLIWEGGHWTMFAVDIVPSPNRVVRLTTSGASPAQGQWSAPATIAVGGMQSGKEPWHMSVIKHAGRYVGLLTDCNIGQSGIDGDLLFIASADGLTFTNSGTTIVPRVQSGEHDSLYRATMVPSAEKGILGYRVWYSGWLNQSPAIWNVYRTWIGPTSGTTANAKAFGSTTTANIATGGSTSIPITFPAGRFVAAPHVQVSTNAGRLTFAVTNITTTGCTIIAANWSPATASSIEIYWKAEEKV
jgi:hypothetical protein